MKRGDIAFAASGETEEEIGKCAVVCDDGVYAGGDLICFRAKAEIDPLFWGFMLNTPVVQRQKTAAAQGATVIHIRRNSIADLIVGYPPIEEQKRIGAALKDIDSLIDNLSKRIEKKKAIKQGAMQELLTGKKRLPGFEGEWEKVELGEIGQVLKGRGISRAESKTGEIPAIRYGEIYTHHNDYVKTYVSHVSEAVAAKALRLKRGDVVFAGSGETVEEIGKSVSVVDDGVCAGGDTIVFSPWEETDPLFWGFLLNMPYVQRQKSLSGHGATIIHIRPSAIKKIQVEIPDVAEQRAIAKVLGDMDAEIAKLEAKREKLTGIKKGMMSDLLTGKVRLKTEME